MIGGSRLGAAFVVLVIGLLDDLRHGRTEKRSAYIGVAALVATAVIYAPALLLGGLGLQHGLFAGLRLEGRDLASLVDRRRRSPDPPRAAHLPRFLLFVAGVLCLLGSFKLFDRVLPDLHAREGPVSLAGQIAYRPWAMFAIGLAVTALTLSVSVSLSLLVPLAARATCAARTSAPTSSARTSPPSSTPCSRAPSWATPRPSAWWPCSWPA